MSFPLQPNLQKIRQSSLMTPVTRTRIDKKQQARTPFLRLSAFLSNYGHVREQRGFFLSLSLPFPLSTDPLSASALTLLFLGTE